MCYCVEQLAITHINFSMLHYLYSIWIFVSAHACDKYLFLYTGLFCRELGLMYKINRAVEDSTRSCGNKLQ